MKQRLAEKRTPGVSMSWRGLAAMCAVLLAGCAAGPRFQPEAASPAAALWLLDVGNEPVALLEVAHPAAGDRVEVNAQGPQMEVALSFANGVRVTPPVKIDMYKPNSLGGTDYVEVDGILQSGLPKASMRDKLKAELSALGQDDTLLIIDKENPSRRILYRAGEPPSVVDSRHVEGE